MSVVPNSTTSICPVCGTPSTRRHSWYLTHRDGPALAEVDAASAGLGATLFCVESACARKIFAERFTTLLPRYSCRTEDVTRLLPIAQRAGGEAGARLARAAGVPTSAHTLRRLLRRQEFILDVAPSELGIDEFALHRRPLGWGLLLVHIQGEDQQVLASLASRVAEIVRNVRGTVDISDGGVVGQPELVVNIDRERAADVGLSAGSVASVLRSGLAGSIVGTFRPAGTKGWDVNVILNPLVRAAW